MTNCTQRLKNALLRNNRGIPLERTLLYTVSHQQTEGEPIILHRAKAAIYILRHVEISVHDEELVAGSHAVKLRAGIMSPEMDPCWLLKELEQFPIRPQGRSGTSEEDKHHYCDMLYLY